MLSRIAPRLTGESVHSPQLTDTCGGRSANRHSAFDWTNGQFSFEHLEHSPRFWEAYIHGQNVGRILIPEGGLSCLDGALLASRFLSLMLLRGGLGAVMSPALMRGTL